MNHQTTPQISAAYPSIFPISQCWVGVHFGEPALLRVISQEPRVLPSWASSIPRMSSPSASISRRGKNVEKCMWEVKMGQVWKDTHQFLSCSIGKDMVLWPHKRLESLPVVHPKEGNGFSWTINVVTATVR